MPKFHLLIIIFLFPCLLIAQSNKREKYIHLKQDTIQLDTLSIIPGSVETRLDSSVYRIDYPAAKMYIKWPDLRMLTDSVRITYRVFPFKLDEERKHKDLKNLHPDQSGGINPFSYIPDTKKDFDIFKMQGLNKNGSISRGITFGNNQDVVVNSNLNLQLSGKLSDDVDLLLAASDQNIPIQAEGNTQQLQEFDKVFIQLSNKNSKLIAGDFQLTRPNSYFMNYNKKSQGLSFSNLSDVNGLFGANSRARNFISASAAVSKGKFARNVIQGSEKNQGPYKLRGAENELFIIVLSGTEKVYLDGDLLERGAENDYTIDYNTAEVRFTPKRLITKDKRIVVEFQYSDKNYARSLYVFTDEFQTGKFRLKLNAYSEQDNRNRPLQQTLSKEDKFLLASVGDSVQQAVVPRADSVAFNTNEVLYKKTDTTSLSGNFTYYGIYVYSTDSTKAHYRLSFSFVGDKKGNYKQVSSSANGKVFQWVMPDTITGTPQGSYEPVIVLIAPKKKQMVTAAAEFPITKNSLVSIEGAMSNNDINEFSSFDKGNDIGYAGKVVLQNVFPAFKTEANSDTSHVLDKRYKKYFLFNANYEMVQKDFTPIERFRPVEFERDWNIQNHVQQYDQHILGSKLGLVQKDRGSVTHQLSYFSEGSVYTGMQNIAHGDYSKKGFLVTGDASLLNSESTENKTTFLRHKGEISKKIKRVVIGVKEAQEDNRIRALNDSLLPSSFSFREWEVFSKYADSLRNQTGICYKQRIDYLSANGELSQATFAENYNFFLELLHDPGSQFKLNATYRKLTISNPVLTSQKPEQTLVGRTEYNFTLLKGVFNSGTYYEIGSGLEQKKEYSFLEVAPGTGVYTWKDYNGNGVKELNEFEISPFPDQANYIKVFTPTNTYISAYTNQFSEVINLRPAVKWNNKKGIKNLISLFSDQAAYRADRKTTSSDLSIAYNPFLKDTQDTALVSLNSSLRNTVFFNQNSPVFGVDYTYNDTRGKQLLTNGIDSRSNIFNEIRLRWNFTAKWTFLSTYKEGNKSSASQYFSVRDYNIAYLDAQPAVSFQPNTNFRMSASFRYSDKQNATEFGGQKAVVNDYGTELRYNILNKGSLQAKANFILISFSDLQNSSVAFEMLEGLKPGQNITWGLTYQRNISGNMQISFIYDGRKPEGVKIIHTGSAQVRAYF